MLTLLLKTHIDGYTKKDGTAVAAHEDKRAKHSPEQMAKWAEERHARIMENARAAEAARQADKARAEKRSAAVGTEGAGKKFTPEEIEAVRGYIKAGDKHGAQAEGRVATINAIQREINSSGIGKVEHVSESHGGNSKSLYIRVGAKLVRVSDHELPQSAQREHNKSQGLTGKWDREVIVLDWQTTELDTYLSDIKGDEVIKSVPMILLLKSYVAPCCAAER